MTTILEARGLSKVFANSDSIPQRVLTDVNLQIEEGEFVSIMGPSGSGKSTLLYNISGMDKMTEGSVVFGQTEISSLSEKELSKLRLDKMGFIFQQSHLLKNLCIFDNIILGAYLNKRTGRKDTYKRATELMAKTGIAEIADRDITQASGGQLQRAAICRALMNNPTVIFGDEPTGALNSRAAAEIMEILADINRNGTTILLVTHDPKVAAKTERVLFMLDGNIVAEKQLGKYKKERNDIKEREETLSKWLIEMDF